MSALVIEAWERHRHALQGFLRRRLADPTLAEDMTQEVFLRLQQAQPEVHDPKHMRAWLLRTARNLLVDYYRSRREHLAADDDIPSVPDPAASLRQLEPCIAPLLARLPEPYRGALTLDLEGFTQREIARRQGVGLSGAKSRVQRARDLLQRQFERCCDYVFDHDDVLVGIRPRG